MLLDFMYYKPLFFTFGQSKSAAVKTAITIEAGKQWAQITKGVLFGKLPINTDCRGSLGITKSYSRPD